MLHIGVVFVVFGIFLIGAGILPDDMANFNLFGEWGSSVTRRMHGYYLIILTVCGEPYPPVPW